MIVALTSNGYWAVALGLGVAAADARALDHAPSLRPLGATGVLFGVLQGVALLRHGDELAWDEAPAYCYVAFLIVLTSVSLWSLLVTGGLWARRPPRPDVRQRE